MPSLCVKDMQSQHKLHDIAVRQPTLYLCVEGENARNRPNRRRMIRFLFRLLAMLSLAIAVIMATLDATRTVAAKSLVVTPLQESWLKTWPEGLAASQAFLEQKVHALAWDPVLLTILALPGFVVFSSLALLLYAIGRRPERRIGRFVVDS